MIHRRTMIGLLIASPLLARPVFAATPDIFAQGGIAIGGTDPVAYFDQMTAVAGTKDYTLMWKGAYWRFSSAGNMAKFEANPDAFAPHYGGYCAYAMSQGHIATTDPAAWTVHDGKLYLNYSKGVRRRWARDMVDSIVLADGHWPDALLS